MVIHFFFPGPYKNTGLYVATETSHIPRARATSGLGPPSSIALRKGRCRGWRSGGTRGKMCRRWTFPFRLLEPRLAERSNELQGPPVNEMGCQLRQVWGDVLRGFLVWGLRGARAGSECEMMA